MQADKTTIKDLSIFQAEEGLSIVDKLNYTISYGGMLQLEYLLQNPLNNIKQIQETQETILIIKDRLAEWPLIIKNGTIMVVNRFYDSQVEGLPKKPSLFEAYSYRFFNITDYSLTKFTINHAIDFLKGMNQLAQLLDVPAGPSLLLHLVDNIKKNLARPVFQKSIRKPKEKLNIAARLQLGHYMLEMHKNEVFELIHTYYKLDAYYSLAMAYNNLGFSMPTWLNSHGPVIKCTNLKHILLKNAVPYSLTLNNENHFLFLTGANMAGKSTLIKSIGVAVYLAHLGIGVPADKLELCYFDGLLSNIQVVDNIFKGESYFFNEVSRIKKTIIQINDGRKWLVLIDELFKGTNVQDAMRCSIEVIKGLLKLTNALVILSTHLYEISEELSGQHGILFRYFETIVEDDELKFSYQLKDGVSNDRLGYFILKREGVVALLNNIKVPETIKAPDQLKH